MNFNNNPDRDKILKRLRKILALTTSSSSGEAAAALHQANKLMLEYGISAQEVDALDIREKESKLSGADVPSWEGVLIAVVCRSLAVEVVIRTCKPSPKTGARSAKRRPARPRAHVVFVGRGATPEIATYAFESLRRQLKRDLNIGILDIVNKTSKVPVDSLKGFSIPTKWRQKYALGWCAALHEKISNLMPEVKVDPAIRANIEARALSAPAVKKSRRKDDDIGSFFVGMGIKDGEKVQLNHALNGGSAVPLLA